MWRDIRFGLRQWRRNKAFAAVIILLLGVGIGANTLIFSFIDAVLLKPLPVRNPQNLFQVEKSFQGILRPDIPFYYPVFKKIQARKDLFSSAIAEQAWSRSSFLPLVTGGSVKMVSTQIVSPNYFSDLGVHAILGRALVPSDATASSVPVVISYEFWQSHFDGNRNVLGRRLRLKNYPFRIVGILPRGFHGMDVDRSPDIRLPVSAAPILNGHSVLTPHRSPFNHPLLFDVEVRIAPDATVASAGAAIIRTARMGEIAVFRHIFSRHPGSSTALNWFIQHLTKYRVSLEAIPHGTSHLRGHFSMALYVLMGAVGLLLLAVCANVSGLLIARAERRRQEIAVRAAVGASRTQLLRQFFIENLLLAIPGAGLGILFAYALAPVLVHLLPEVRMPVVMYAVPEIIHVPLDQGVLWFTIGVAAFSIFVFGLAPALLQTKAGFISDLTGSRQSRHRHFSGILTVAVQVGLGVVLVAGALLMMRTFWNLEHANPGFDYTHIVSFSLNPKAAGYSGKQTNAFLHELNAKVAVIPGVRSDAYTVRGVMREIGMKTVMVQKGKVLPKDATLNTSFNAVTPSYFRTMGIPLLLGRTFEASAKAKLPSPVVVNRAFADYFFPHQSPIGKELINGWNGNKRASIFIVGVVGNAKYRSMREIDPRILYFPLDAPFAAQMVPSGVVLCVRTFGNPKAVIGEVRSAIHRIDARVPIVAITTVEQEALSTVWKARLMMLLAGFFAIVSLFLAAAGIYGSLAYSVASRTREIGIRMAIGAQQRDILSTVCGRISIAVGFGAVCGIIAAAFLLKLAQSLFFGVQALDPYAFSAAVFGLLFCGMLGAAVPVLRAVHTDPAQALRVE